MIRQTYIKFIKSEHFHITIILFTAGFLYLLGNSVLPVTDPVESNYALTAKEMLLQNNYLSPQIFNHYWYDKPVFYYIELIIGFKLFGISNFGARFFSALLGIVNIGLLYKFVYRVSNKKNAIISAVLYATSAEFWIISKAVITDMTLALFLNITLMSFYIGYRKHILNQNYTKYYYIAYIGSALAVLTKGPIGFLLPGLIIFIYLGISRNLKELLHLKIPTGLLILVTLSGSWYSYMYMAHGSDFINVFFGVHNWLRATLSEHPKFNVWYYYIIVTVIALFPWSFILPYKLYTQKQALYDRKNVTPLTMYLITWGFAIILFFSCMATKYTTYTFPALAPITVLIAILCKRHYLFIRNTAFVTVCLYGILTYTVAYPLMKNASSPLTSRYIHANIPSDTTILNSRRNYRVSTTYYSDHIIYQLEPARSTPVNPLSLSWDAKKIMPFIYTDQLPQNTPLYLLTDTNRFPSFLDKSQWSLIETNVEGCIYKYN